MQMLKLQGKLLQTPRHLLPAAAWIINHRSLPFYILLT
jgi:hypothetical protein